MMLYALVGSDNQIDRTHSFLTTEIPQTKQGWRWIPVEADPRPPYNPELQVATETEIVEQQRVYRYWTVRDKTSNEIESDKIQKINAIDPTIIKALLDLYNKVSSTPLTEEEYRIYLRSLI